jgi:hypothetical protein
MATRAGRRPAAAASGQMLGSESANLVSDDEAMEVWQQQEPGGHWSTQGRTLQA